MKTHPCHAMASPCGLASPSITEIPSANRAPRRSLWVSRFLSVAMTLALLPLAVGQDRVVQGGNGANGTAVGKGADGTAASETLTDADFNSIQVISGNGGDSGGGNSGGKGGHATLTLTAPVVTVSGNVLVKTGSDGDDNTGAWCGVPSLTVQNTLRAPSIEVESTNGGDYRITVNTLDVSEDTTIIVSGLDGAFNCSFETVNIADGKTLTINNANGALRIGTINFTGSGTGRVVIADSSRLIMDSLNFFHSAAFDIPASSVGNPIASIDISGGVVFGGVDTMPYTFSATGLPAGISIDANTGVISGTPAAAGLAGAATITVTDKNLTTRSITISYGTISAHGGTAPTITTTTLPDGIFGTTYSQNLTATSDTPVTWSIASGALPAGLTLDGATGEISGTPTTGGTTSFTVKASNGVSPDATKVLSLMIAIPPTLPDMVLSQETWDADPNGDSITITVNSNRETGFAAQVSASALSWLTVSASQLEDTLTLTAAPNTGAARDATIIVSAGSDSNLTSATITVTQASPATPIEGWTLAGLDTKGIKLSAPKSLVVPKGTKLAKGTKAVYVWKDAAGNILNKTDKKGNVVSAKTYTAKADGSFTVELRYTPLAEDGKTALPEVTETHSFGKVKLFAPLKLAKTSGFVAEPLGVQVLDAKGRPAANTVVEGESLRLTVTLASGTGPLRYTWYKNKEVVQTTESSYSLTDTFDTPAYGAKPDSFSVVVETVARDAKGVKPLTSVKSKAIKAKVIIKPTVTITTPAAKLTAAAGKSVTIAAKAKGTAKLVYEWRDPSGNIINDAKGKPVNKASLTLKPASKTATITTGTYTVRVTNGAGDQYAATASATVSLTATVTGGSATNTAGYISSSASAIISSVSIATTYPNSSSQLSLAQTVVDSSDTLRLTEATTGNATLLNLSDASLQNLRYETLSANTGLLCFDRIGENDGDAVWETVTLNLAFAGANSGDYVLTTLRTRVDATGDLVDETETATGVFEVE